LTGFEHRKTDVVITIRFRNDVWRFLEDLMREKKHQERKHFLAGTSKGYTIKKSVHTVLDEELRKNMK